jgi:sugar phosphate isomerase/epimerase
MVAYGFPDRLLDHDLTLAARLGAELLEIFPDWRAFPDPWALRKQVESAGLAIHSAHGCWGGQTIRAPRVDLGQLDTGSHRESVEDLKHCIDWLAEAGGTFLVVHPGGLSEPEQTERRREALARGLRALAVHARGSGVVVCVENMPPGVHPGSRMVDLFALVAELDEPELALALDTGHAHITSSAPAETIAAGQLLRTTHVHDNEGRQDTHHPPGLGTIDWPSWVAALDAIDYRGPVMLECVRHLRKDPGCLDDNFWLRLDQLTGGRAGEHARRG